MKTPQQAVTFTINIIVAYIRKHYYLSLMLARLFCRFHHFLLISIIAL